MEMIKKKKNHISKNERMSGMRVMTELDGKMFKEGWFIPLLEGCFFFLEEIEVVGFLVEDDAI